MLPPSCWVKRDLEKAKSYKENSEIKNREYERVIEKSKKDIAKMINDSNERHKNYCKQRLYICKTCNRAFPFDKMNNHQCSYFVKLQHEYLK